MSRKTPSPKRATGPAVEPNPALETAATADGPDLKDFVKDKAPKAKNLKLRAKTSRVKPSSHTEAKAHKAVGIPVAVGLSVIAAIAGAAGGWIGPKIFDPANAAPAKTIMAQGQSIESLDSQIVSLRQAANALTQRVKSAETTLEARSGQGADIADLQTQLQALADVDHEEDRITSLKPLALRLDALETVIAPQGEPDDGAVEEAQQSVSALLGRITDLETRLAEMRAQPPVTLEPAILSYSTAAINTGETATLTTQDEPPSATGAAYDLAANFPRAKMLTALAAQSQNVKEPSWIRRMIARHFDMGDVSVSADKSAILKAETLTRSGDIEGAIQQIEGLNPTLRAAAHHWIIEAKKQR